MRPKLRRSVVPCGGYENIYSNNSRFPHDFRETFRL
uniref:Uncharacterized protein n=1 Tax=Rhizophora mucronata TaxID=61149 RepID=A0A2P2IY93_RHIMU